MSNTQPLETEEISRTPAVTQRAQNLIEAGNRAVIDSRESYAKGADLIKLINQANKAADQERRSWVDPLNAQVKRINEQFKLITDPLTKCKDKVNKAMTKYLNDEENRIREEQRQIREAEQKRIAAEQEAAQKAAAEAEAAKTKAAEEGDEVAQKRASVQERIAQARMKAKEKEAELATAEPINQPVTGTAFGELATVSKRVTWKFELTDLKAVCMAVAKGELSVEALQLNEQWVRQQIKEGVRDMAGVRIYEDAQAVVR